MWKKHEKAITQEDALQMARQEAAPFWFGSLPLFFGVYQEDQALLLPLNPDFNKKSWLILFRDGTRFSNLIALDYLAEWTQRYSLHGLNSLILERPVYFYMRDKQEVQKWAYKSKDSLIVSGFPSMIDLSEIIAKVFSVSHYPQWALYHQGQSYLSAPCLSLEEPFRKSLDSFYQNVEEKIQYFLRLKDPGLPLLPMISLSDEKKIVDDVSQIELGSQTAAPDTFLPQSFEEFSGNLKIGYFNLIHPQHLPEGKVFLFGKWVQDPERIYTADSEAWLMVRCRCSEFSVVAQSFREFDTASLTIELNSGPVHEIHRAKDVIADEFGKAVLKLNTPHFYHLLTQMPQMVQPSLGALITLRFPNAQHAPIALYGFRLGHCLE